MKILRGIYRDRGVRLWQGANDWLSVDVLDPAGEVIANHIVRPTNLLISHKEWLAMADSGRVDRSFFNQWLYNADTGRVEASD